MPLYFDATFSWSGYAYQGKVGVFVVLKHLNQYNENNLNIYFNDWELEFEWLEDFSIKQSGTYKSLHQVKTLKSTRIASYDAAITQTIENAQNAFNYNITPYFHVSSNVISPNEIFYEYNINGNTQHYCPLNQIDNLVKEQIGIFVAKYNSRDNNGEAIDTHFVKLLAIIDNHVRQRHQNIQNQPANTRQIEYINFSEIITSLMTDSMQLSQERMIYEKKAYFVSIVDEYCQDKDANTKRKINDICRELLNLNDIDFIYFIKSISPHVQTSSDNLLTLTDFQNLLQKDPTKDSFLVSMNNINDFHTFMVNKYLTKSNDKYMPTTINRSESAKNEICQDILDNSYAIENLFEMDYFITERIACESIAEEAYNTTEIRDEDLPDIDSQESKINELKKVKMIKLTDAERILNA